MPVTSGGRPFSDLGLDYAIGQVLQGISILQGRGSAPGWAAEHAGYLVQVLTDRSMSPPGVVEAAVTVCRVHGHAPPQVLAGLRSMELEGAPGVEGGSRALQGFLVEWRKALAAGRPAPRFGDPR